MNTEFLLVIDMKVKKKKTLDTIKKIKIHMWREKATVVHADIFLSQRNILFYASLKFWLYP